MWIHLPFLLLLPLSPSPLHSCHIQTTHQVHFNLCPCHFVRLESISPQWTEQPSSSQTIKDLPETEVLRKISTSQNPNTYSKCWIRWGLSFHRGDPGSQRGEQPMELDSPSSNPDSLLISCVTFDNLLTSLSHSLPLCGVEILIIVWLCPCRLL